MQSSLFKTSLRKKLKQLRDERPIDHCVSAAVIDNLSSWISEQSYFTVGFYLPIFHEVDLVPFMTSWLERNPGKKAAIPVIENNQMFFAEWSPETKLTKGIFNTLVPQTIRKIAPDLLLVPCLGFDNSNYRLGYGGGWYDRYLSQTNPRPFTVGIAYSQCRIETIEPEETDIPLGLIITDESKSYSKGRI
ncbi:5-formyltetrahydrofolate cyclo-ligase [Turicimonas muris]|uniref:5-formyltetrahydrofolate cyclo-ligase n=1 Tax=Turicimonas muris TaxID=1796652 RepID=UPI0023F43BAD|nr:5-formyltetrahydrofolate cyclo-ligase [Turicimonas muris]